MFNKGSTIVLRPEKGSTAVTGRKCEPAVVLMWEKWVHNYSYAGKVGPQLFGLMPEK